MKMYCDDGTHQWETEPFDANVPDVFACSECIANARKVGKTMVIIMCSERGCTHPAWGVQEPEDRWVCDGHYIGVIIM